jgi:hypothetical protein
MYKLCPSNKAILTHYPPSHGQYDKILENKVTPTYTCNAHFENNFHIISEAIHIKQNKDSSKPFRTPYASAGLLFGHSDFLNEAPFDPYLPYLFQGEEILLSARLWTNGWDLFNLNDSVITHYYNREKDNQPHFWDDHGHKSWHKVQKQSNNRYYYILEQLGESDVDPLFLTHVSDYGIGNQRTLKSWFDFTGIDIKNKKVESRCSQTYNETTQKWEDN